MIMKFRKDANIDILINADSKIGNLKNKGILFPPYITPSPPSTTPFLLRY